MKKGELRFRGIPVKIILGAMEVDHIEMDENKIASVNLDKTLNNFYFKNRNVFDEKDSE